MRRGRAGPPSAVAQIAARDDQLRLEALDQSRCRHARSQSSSPAPKWRSERCKTRVSTAGGGYSLIRVTEESAEIFDDLYLGLRAGGAIRKQRRGEP